MHTLRNRPSRRVKHGALIDSEILAEVYMELKGGRQTSLTFAIHKEILKIAPATAPAQRGESLEGRLTIDDMTDHSRFVGTLGGGSMWSRY